MPAQLAVEGQICPFVARALAGDEVLAESTGAVQEGPGGSPRLYFPLADVRTERMISSRRDGYVAFDREQVKVEIVDPMEGTDERDVTLKRFPTWGDASDLVDVLDVSPDAYGRFSTRTRGFQVRSVVEGSQMLGQAIVAAGRRYPARRAVSAHMVFLRPADTDEPLCLDLKELGNGKTFTTVSVEVAQGGFRCAAGTLLLDMTVPDLVRHQAVAPAVPGPYECEPLDMSVTGRDIRVVEGAYTGDPDAPVGPPLIDAWVRFRSLPDDPPLHAGLLAQFTGHMSIAAALRAHPGIGQDQAHQTISMAINAIAMSIHADVQADRWMLYHHESTFAGEGMTHAECRVHDEEGRLLASFSVEAMVRPFAGAGVAPDPKTAL